jgi:hypothetical protein
MNMYMLIYAALRSSCCALALMRVKLTVLDDCTGGEMHLIRSALGE